MKNTHKDNAITFLVYPRNTRIFHKANVGIKLIPFHCIFVFLVLPSSFMLENFHGRFISNFDFYGSRSFCQSLNQSTDISNAATIAIKVKEKQRHSTNENQNMHIDMFNC